MRYLQKEIRHASGILILGQHAMGEIARVAIHISSRAFLRNSLADGWSIPVCDDVLEVILGGVLPADVVLNQQRAGLGGIDFYGLRRSESRRALILAFDPLEFSKRNRLRFRLERMPLPLIIDEADVDYIAGLTATVNSGIDIGP